MKTDALNKIEVVSLVGRSGTGKSFQAGNLCNNLGIDGIIDDGLFIMNGRILAGISAKRQDTKIRAIKTALFKTDEQRDEVAAKIKELAPASLLVLGTSDRMIALITERLGLPSPSRRFGIENLTTETERNYARRQREELGQHIIPAPTVHVKKDFSGYFIHPIRSFKDLRDDLLDGLGTLTDNYNPFTEGKNPERPFSEKSVVRPTYSYLGRYTISDKAIRDIIELCAAEIPELDDIPLIFIKKRPEGLNIELGVIVRYGIPVMDVARRLQRLAAKHVENITSINVLAVNIEIQGLCWSQVSRRAQATARISEEPQG